MTDLAARRLHSQRLAGTPCTSPVDVVSWLTAVQSQDYGGAKWGIAQRTVDITEAEIDQLFDEGAILRTHVLRPTWHFVLPDDIRWLLELTGPRVRAGLASRYRQLEIDDDLIARAYAAFAEALSGGRSLTRPEMGDVLRVSGIVTEGQRLPHLLMAAELDGLIISGPRRGKQHTFALLAERAPNAGSLPREEALAELTRRYFTSHGPAQLQDFAWWSGLSLTDIRTGIALAGDRLAHEVVDGKDYWFDAEAGIEADGIGPAHLLPNFDEYTVSYRDRAAAIDPDLPFNPALFSYGNILSNVVTLGGRVAPGGKR
jgi:winged helix DNA-binding protein